MSKDKTYCFNRKLTKYKFIEVQFSYWRNWTDYFVFNCSWTRNVDHAGFSLIGGVCGLEINLSVLDYRHWNHKENRWYLENEEVC